MSISLLYSSFLLSLYECRAYVSGFLKNWAAKINIYLQSVVVLQHFSLIVYIFQRPYITLQSFYFYHFF